MLVGTYVLRLLCNLRTIWYLRLPAGICNAAVSLPIAPGEFKLVKASQSMSTSLASLPPSPQNTVADIFIQDNDAGDDHCTGSRFDHMVQFLILPEI